MASIKAMGAKLPHLPSPYAQIHMSIHSLFFIYSCIAETENFKPRFFALKQYSVTTSDLRREH